MQARPGDGEVELADESDPGRRPTRSDSLAAWAFAAYVAVALPLVLFNLGANRWFFRDDWFFIAGNANRAPNDLWTPAGYNSHWSTIPVVVFRVLWHTVGLRSYVPYQAAVVILHLTAAVLLRVIMRRAGVRPWIATVAAASFVLFGPGETNIVWAFQVGLVGALVFGLIQLILADHDGPFDRRDWAGLAAGVLALMCSGVGTTMAVVVGIATLLRRGWRIAAAHTAPLAVIYLAYTRIEHPDLSPFGRPPVGTLFQWVRSQVTGTFVALGYYRVLAVAFVAVLVVGLVLAIRPDVHVVRRTMAVPVALLAGGLVFAISTGVGRWIFGVPFARSSRYLHLFAAFMLPALAVAADALVRRWRALLPLVLAGFLVPIPWNIAAFGSAYFVSQETLLLDSVRVPFATQVPRNTHPIVDPFLNNVTIGFLLDAQRAGRMPHDDKPVESGIVNELKVRLGVAQSKTPNHSTRCQTHRAPLDITPAKGTVYRMTTPVRIATHDGSRLTSPAVTYLPHDGHSLAIQLDGLDLRVMPGGTAKTFTLCTT
jgi:hypothetical protein